MTHFLFVDESGQDHRESPYEVLAGLAIDDRDLWNLIQSVQLTEVECFGTRYSSGARELKGSKLLKAKTFRHARLASNLDSDERVELARACLLEGQSASPRTLAALAQAKLEFVRRLFDLVASFRGVAFGMIINKHAPRPAGNEMLRRDYSFLFQRFFYFLEDIGPTAMGAVVFDELERSRSHILVNQMYAYFEQTVTGRQRAGRVIPEPFFVHSDLTTGVQLADLLAYTLSWGFRGLRGMVEPRRRELEPFVRQACGIRYDSVRKQGSTPDFKVRGFHYIKDLRPGNERTC